MNPPAARIESLTILIAEDNAADRLLLSTIVSRQGHRVLTAGNGLRRWRCSRPSGRNWS